MASLTELLDIQQAAARMLKPLLHSPTDIITTLRPRDDDYDRVFVPGAAERAREGYKQLWGAPPESLGSRDQTEILDAIATNAESLAGNTALPGGYKAIAHLCQPGIPWLTFKVVAPGKSSGMTHNGLVFLGDHWAWFPKPWRVLGDEGTS